MKRSSITHHGLAILLSAFVTACGGVSSAPAPDCTGQSCMCAAATTCAITTQTCGGSCTLACGADATCNGTCGDSCSVDCGENASCGITLGASGSISCKAGSSCDVTCVGDCSVSCANTAVCRVKCPGETGFAAVSGGGGC